MCSNSLGIGFSIINNKTVIKMKLKMGYFDMKYFLLEFKNNPYNQHRKILKMMERFFW